MERKFDTLEDVVTTGKVVAVRVDFNVPMNDGIILDVSRIRAAAGTVQFLRNSGAKILLLSHFGRPKNGFDPKLSNGQLVEACSSVFGIDVRFVDEISRNAISGALEQMDYGEVALLENLRFYEGETKNDQNFARIIADYCNVYVNDAFSCSHRSHASVDALAGLVRSVAGFSLVEEVDSLDRLFLNAGKPLVAVLGGSKVSTKIELLESLSARCKMLCLGGGMANTVLKYKGLSVGASVCESGVEEVVGKFLRRAKENNCEVLLPVDAVVCDSDSQVCNKSVDELLEGDRIFDVGPRSVEMMKGAISKAKTVIMNGPLGMYEKSPFEKGTKAVVEHVAQRVRDGLLTGIAGGGDIVACLNQCGVRDDFTFVSSGGGAFLEFISGLPLPGVVALTNAKARFDAEK